MRNLDSDLHNFFSMHAILTQIPQKFWLFFNIFEFKTFLELFLVKFQLFEVSNWEFFFMVPQKGQK